ncbi:MAG TPA: hypothetical protein VFZ22_19085 [Pyrinomonadaceae bacterium]|nr:hypothetical protein [Pyrinomonadaceae bacterium]
MSSDQAKLIAERVARRVSSGGGGGADLGTELAAIRGTLSDIQDRLTQIESKVNSESAGPRVHSPWLAGVNASHPSQERFGVEEATVSQLVDFFQNEKTCSVEPGGKPCDHCSMCSSRGF